MRLRAKTKIEKRMRPYAPIHIKEMPSGKAYKGERFEITEKKLSKQTRRGKAIIYKNLQEEVGGSYPEKVMFHVKQMKA